MDSITPDTPQKQCSKCKQFFPPTREFYTAHAIAKDGLYPSCKACNRARNAEYARNYRKSAKSQEYRKQYSKKVYQEHWDEIRAYQKQYYSDHRDESIAYKKQYRKDHLDLIHAQEKRSKQKHKEAVRIRKKRWQQGETYKAYQKRYQKVHKERLRSQIHHRYMSHAEEVRLRQRMYGKTERGRLSSRLHYHKRKAQKKAIECSLTGIQIQEKLKHQRYRCYYCHDRLEKRNEKYVYHLEHTIPLSRTEHNPRHDINYVVLSCPTCNLKKGTKLPHEWPEGGRLF